MTSKRRPTAGNRVGLLYCGGEVHTIDEDDNSNHPYRIGNIWFANSCVELVEDEKTKEEKLSAAIGLAKALSDLIGNSAKTIRALELLIEELNDTE